MIIGYARVSTDDQSTANQIPLLKKAGCERIYEETASGAKWEREQLQACMKHLRHGDVLIVWKLDRLSRSLKDLLQIMDQVDKAGATFKSLTETVDTTGACGRLMLSMLGAFAAFERDMIKERTKLGLKRAKANGKQLGGRFLLSPARQAEAVRMVTSGEKTQQEAAEIVGVSKATMSRIMDRQRGKELKKAGLL
jgi:DNA invertase Pin-like site-specific DNA recombinase